MNNEIIVQVLCVTHNHEKYIKDAILGFLKQKTNFKYEVLIGDDCSTDKTSEIVSRYAKKYPNIIKHLRHDKNMGSMSNFMYLCKCVSAKYVAFCDGDDYWTDENKLQKQFDFMEKYKKANICAHRVEIDIDPKCSLYKMYSKYKTPFVCPNHIKHSKFLTIGNVANEIPHLSSFFVRWKNINFPDWVYSVVYGDLVVAYFMLGDGNLFILKDIMSVYRKNDTGVTFDNTNVESFYIKTRPAYFTILSGVIDYYKNNYNHYGIKSLEKRFKREISDFVRSVIVNEDWQQFEKIKSENAEVFIKIKQILLEGFKLGLKHTKMKF